MRVLFLAIIAAGIFTITSCSKEPVVGPQGPQGSQGPTGSTGATGPTGPSFSGNISGRVELFNQHGAVILNNLSGIQVKVEETGQTVNTDAQGKYNVNNISTGNYTITYSDPNNVYGLAKATSVQYVSGTLYKNAKLSQIPTFNISSCNANNVSLNGGNYVRVITTASASSSQPRALAVYVGNASSVSSNLSNHLKVYEASLKAGQQSDTLLVPVQHFYAAGFTPGNTAFLRVYPAAVEFMNSSSSLDLSTGRTVFHAIGTNSVNASVTLP